MRKVVGAIAALALAIAWIPVGVALDSGVIELRTSEAWQHGESGESAIVITSSEYGCREWASRRHVLAPGGGRWIFEIWEGPRDGYSRQRLVDDVSGWSLQIEDREPPWPDFVGPQDFARSRFWDKVSRGEYVVERSIQVTGGGKANHRYKVVEGAPLDTDSSEVRSTLEVARSAAPEILLSRLRLLLEMTRSEQAEGSGFVQYAGLMELIEGLLGSQAAATAGGGWVIEDTRAFRRDAADAAALEQVLRAFARVGDPADPLAGLHVSQETCGGGEDLPGSG